MLRLQWVSGYIESLFICAVWHTTSASHMSESLSLSTGMRWRQTVVMNLHHCLPPFSSDIKAKKSRYSCLDATGVFKWSSLIIQLMGFPVDTAVLCLLGLNASYYYIYFFVRCHHFKWQPLSVAQNLLWPEIIAIRKSNLTIQAFYFTEYLLSISRAHTGFPIISMKYKVQRYTRLHQQQQQLVC